MAFPLDPAASRPSSSVSGVVSPPPRMPSRSRTQSISSDRPSTVAYSMMSPPLSVSPEPVFIAASAASQIVTNDHDSHAETWYDQHGIEPSGETAAASPGALQLVNNFLDQLLFNFLSVSRATTLSALRPAVSDVLKPKLAKDAINQADEELREYLGGDDEDSAPAQPPADWDLELAWKRTRLRCMVYSSLGDLEEEDEDYYMEQGHLDSEPEDRLAETVSPAVAIFLTSILEFMGEQALIVAGQAAYHRMRHKYEKELKEGARTATGVADRIVVEELDMERVALDRTLGRLWRSWKKKIRSPGIASMDRLTRSYSRDSLRSASGHLCSPSSAAELGVPATVPEPHAEAEQERIDSANLEESAQDGPLEESLVAAAIPLPIGPNDVAEIEVPGLARCIDDEIEEAGAEDNTGSRPKSLMILPRSIAQDPLTLKPSGLQLPRGRSNSLPPPARPRHATLSDLHLDQPAKEPTKAGAVDSPAESRPGDIADAKPDLVTGEHVTEEDEPRDEDDDEEVSIEEPRIVRSSRVSILGRSPSTASSDHGKPAAINTSLPVRTPSIHSARLIDVASPRSPVPGSRRSSVAVSDPARHSNPSLNTRTITPPVSEDRPEHPLDSSSGGRSALHHGAKSGLAASQSISEMGQHIAGNNSAPASSLVPSATQAGGSLPAVPEPVAKEQYEPAEPDVRGHVGEPSTPPKAMAKTAVLPPTSSPGSPASTASSTFVIETMPVLSEGREAREHHRAGGQRYPSSSVEQLPVVPEKSTGRQTVANTSALRQPAAIGQVSVERTRTRSPSQDSLSRAGEQSAGRTRQQTSSSSPSSTKLKPVRASEEGVQSRIDVVRDFEELIQSDETIQYTLTPESMRNFDLQTQSTRPVAAGGSTVSAKMRKSEEARQSGSRSRSSSSPQNENRPPTSAPRSSGSGSNTVTDAYQVKRNPSSATARNGGVVPRSLPPVPSKPRVTSGPQPRDAKLPRDSVAELAEFFRSTGPAGGTTGATAPVGPGRTRNQGSISNISISTSRMSTTSNPNRPKYQARGATVDYKDDNSDLIDFIRRGPPSVAGNPRIPRAVAPFRTTMDSDQLSGVAVGGGRAVDAQLRDVPARNSPASTHATESSVPPSIQSSINSHSALLAKNKAMSYDTVDDDMPMPKRKTRRVRDPYAIDISDEEEELEDGDELTPMPVPARKKVPAREESLIDFLNNCPPPQEPTVQPLDIPQTRSHWSSNLKPKRKASAPSLMARFTRRDSSAQQQQQQSGVLPSSKRSSSPRVSESTRSLNSRASGGKGTHVPIQVTMSGGVAADQYAPPPIRTSSKVAATLGGGPAGVVSGGPRVPMKRFEPREAASVSGRTATSDLADFLKHSGPPPGATVVVSQLPGAPGERTGDSFPGLSSRMFGKRKKPSFS
ncbi:hypothetical protein N658DRAFT_420459 [Parathielavia hyrcaniae]|uniref:Flo11 n=1 Tax=Parathielavia hyrcaniae TaxID=113614 RepID=A0AAN6Q6A2_9PEZI|nr:hypothetical protein N658DRAFT_420459 [Parathielavia hyrcaniae]